MKYLIVEDDFTARTLLKAYLSDYGDCSVAVNGCEAVEAVREALQQGKPYDLICLDIMMPEMNGHDTLKAIRQIEIEHGMNGPNAAKVIMTTALSDFDNITDAFRTGCEGYLVKPVRKDELLGEMRKLGLIQLEPHQQVKSEVP